MTPGQMRIAIAKRCRIKNICHEYNGKLVFFDDVPDYPNDLNAMHEAEKVLTDEEYLRYEDKLWGILLIKKGNVETTTAGGSVILMPIDRIRGSSADAAERAEAFLRITGDWKD